MVPWKKQWPARNAYACLSPRTKLKSNCFLHEQCLRILIDAWLEHPLEAQLPLPWASSNVTEYGAPPATHGLHAIKPNKQLVS